jgi:hypothetical protein
MITSFIIPNVRRQARISFLAYLSEMPVLQQLAEDVDRYENVNECFALWVLKNSVRIC